MRNILAALAIMALAPVVSPAAAETEHVTRTVALEPGGTLRLKTFSGRVTITATDRPDVVVDAVRNADRDRLARIALDVHREGDTVVVDANHHEDSWWGRGRNNVVETEFDIKVPRRTNIEITTFSAPVTVTGVEGSYHVHGFSSFVRLQDAIGPIEAHTFSGGVEIQARAWRPDQTIDVETFSGSVELRVPDDARGRVTFRSFSGHLNSDKPLTLRESGRRNLTADLGSPDGGRLRFKTFSGSVHIDR